MVVFKALRSSRVKLVLFSEQLMSFWRSLLQFRRSNLWKDSLTDMKASPL